MIVADTSFIYALLDARDCRHVEAASWYERELPEPATTRLGLTDASLVALLGRLEEDRIATFDERHFRAVRPRSRHDAYVILPADA